MSKKKRKHLEAQFAALTRPQLIALATQKEVLPYIIAVGMSTEALVEALIVVEGVLKPVGTGTTAEAPGTAYPRVTQVEPESGEPVPHCDWDCDGCCGGCQPVAE